MNLCMMIEGQEDVRWQEWVAIARACEDNAIPTLFRSDHYSSVMGKWERGSLDAWATISGLAAVTETLRLGTLVSPGTFRHPSNLAKCVVTADHISGGRVELGMGAGWHEPEHEQYGFDFFDAKTRTDMFVEQIEIVHRSWTQESFDFSGRHYTISKLRAEPKPASDPHPRLLVGGGGGYRSVRAAARWADEYNTLTEDLAELERVRQSLDEACEEIGRDPASLALSLMTRGIVAEDRDDLVNRVETTLEVSGRDMTPQEYIDARGEAALVGTTDQVAEKLERIEQRGVARVMLQHLAHRDIDMIELVGRLQRG